MSKDKMKLSEFFLREADAAPTFKAGPPAAQAMQPGQQAVPEAPEIKKGQTMNPAILKYLQDIEGTCSKIIRRNDVEPELKTFIHKFLLDLNKHMGEDVG